MLSFVYTMRRYNWVYSGANPGIQKGGSRTCGGLNRFIFI